MTGLMYNRRVSKTHPRVEACGCVDELSAALGLARASTKDAFIATTLLETQRELITLMGELATGVEDLDQYVKDGFPRLTSAMTVRLDEAVRVVESAGLTFRGWALPGETPSAAALDFARTVCRRAERCICKLEEAGQLRNPEIMVYLNRLSDVLWLLARRAENE